MKTIKSKKIAAKVTKQIVIGLIAVFIVLIAVIATIITNELVDREQEKLTLLANENAGVAREFMEALVDKQEVISHTVKSLNGMDDNHKINIMNSVITATKQGEKNTLSLFFVSEPNSFITTASNGYAIVATDQGTVSEPDMFKYINKEMYESAKEIKKMTIADPFDKTIDGKQYKVITVTQPVLDEKGEVIGMVGANIDTAVLNGADYNTGGFETFLTQIICGHQTVITNSKNPESIGKSYTEVSESTNTQLILDSAKEAEPLSFLDENTNGQKYYKSYVPFYIKGSSVVWLSGTSIMKSEFDSHIVKQIALISICLVLALIILAAIAYFRVNKSLKPIKILEQSVKKLSEGNLHDKMEFTSNDELGSLADSLRESISILFSYVSDIDRAMGEMASGNFDVTPSQPFIGDFKPIETSISGLIVNMSDTLGKIGMSANQVMGGSEQVSSGSQELAQGAAEQASSIEELAAAMDEISRHVRENSKNVQMAEEMSKGAKDAVVNSNSQMQSLMDAINKINEKSTEIGKIIKTIEDIAFQTNILALNAAVEAARAGEAGKGFAVVADEVRSLAVKSSEAAKNTTELIKASVESVDVGVKLAEETAKEMLGVVDGANATTEIIIKIAEATVEQARALNQITTSVDQISMVVQTNSATSEESSAASEELSSQAHLMNSLVKKFRLFDLSRLRK